MQENNNWQQQAWQQPQGDQQQQQPVYPQNVYQTVPVVPSYAPVQQPKKSRGWIVALVAVILFFVFMFAGLASCTSMMNASVNSLGGIGSMTGFDSIENLNQDAIGVITIRGTIQYDGSVCSPEGLKEQLDRAEENPHIKAIVLRVDSGGGVATAGEEMCAYLQDFQKPIVVSSAATNASAAYEISAQADYIFTAKTTFIGAIGTVMQITDLSGLLDKLGISVDNVSSADSKDSSYGTRPLTEDERAYYQDLIDKANETFIENVATGRNMPIEEVRKLATGMVFTGMDAVENGLADEIGTKEDAIEKAADLARISHYTVVDLKPNRSYDLSALIDILSESRTSIDGIAFLKELEQDGIVVK